MAEIVPRMSAQTLKVLKTFLASPRGELAGTEIAHEARIGPGTLYPILMRLERAGWLDSRWEAADPSALGRPRRRYYRITAIGAASARAVFQELMPAFGQFAWA